MFKPRIAILHYATLPTIGGVESTIAAHARLFAAHGYPVRLITGSGEPFDPRVPVDVIQDIGSKSARVLDVNSELARGIVGTGFHSLADELACALEQVLARDGGTTHLIVHNALSLHKNLALTASLKKLVSSGLNLIAWCHDFAWADPQYGDQVHSGFPWDLLRHPWARVRYVVVSEARKAELQDLWHASTSAGDNTIAAAETPIAVVPPGIDPLEFLHISPQVARWARQFDLFAAAPLLLLPARLTRRKNIEYAIEITAALREQGLSAKLIITGPPGPHNPTNAAYLEKLVSLRAELGLAEQVIFLHEFGAVHDSQMRDLYLLADALIFPSEREGFGIPILEAGLARLPVFCSDIPPFRESAGERACYLAPGQPAAAAAAQIAVQLSRDKAYQLKHHVLTEFSWETIFTERIVPLLKDI